MAGFVRVRPDYDIVVLGGGHAGLQAGLKSALLHHTALVLDRGPKFGRSYYAPSMANIPGFPGGISGHKLLDLQIQQLRAAGEKVGYLSPMTLGEVRREGAGYVVEFERLSARHTVRSRVLVLALGVVDAMPHIQGKIDPIFPWANQGIVDYCVFCDGHTLTGKSVGVLGATPFAARTALDLRHWEPSSLTLLTHDVPLFEGVPGEEARALREELRAAGIDVLEGPITALEGIREKRFEGVLADGRRFSFDKGFSALGWYTTHDALPRALGARITAEGYVATDEDCRALAADGSGPIPGLYAVGDLRDGWNQIPEAWATAERAIIHAYASYL